MPDAIAQAPAAPAPPAPELRRPVTQQITTAELASPAMLRMEAPADAAFGAALGFNFILTAEPANLAPAQAAGIGALLELCLDAPGGGVEETHPDWFVHGPHGPSLRFLSDRDETVDWWDEVLAGYQKAGFAGFYFRNASRAPRLVWQHLLSAALARNPDTILIAEIFGADPLEAAGLEGLGFSFATSSSCYWDFAAGWLNADTARTEAIAPALAFAAPPGSAPLPPEAMLRALSFSANFAPAWAVERNFIAGGDFTAEISALNAQRRAHAGLEAARLRSSPGSAVAILARGENFAIAVNASLSATAEAAAASILTVLGHGGLRGAAVTLGPGSTLTLGPGETAIFEAAGAPPVFLPVAPRLDVNAPRLAIEAITPQVDAGQFPARRIIGSLVTIEADILADGHDKLAAEILLRAADEKTPRAYAMTLINNDRWSARIPLERLGRHFYKVAAWRDAFATFTDEITKKHAAGVNISLELQEGLALVEEAIGADKKSRTLLARLRAADEGGLREILLSPQMAEIMRRAAPRKFLSLSHEIALDAERPAAAFASWYEIFPRSQSAEPGRHGNFQDVINQLPRIAGMGFDVLYMPPIHPIGAKNRKGKNNSLQAGPDDPGSPYAIGSAEGGHDAIHPELGTLEDFRALIAAAKNFKLELALDFAIQCAPDHPWITEHKDWFDWRPDGSLRHAENPPKKYEDIVNVDFYAQGAKPALWLALRDAVQFWVDQGIRIFRVDNPHTKPFPFWEWLIADINSRHPDTMFLAEAFTRPKLMYRLAKIGFSQSYSYFTWRNTKPELEEYLNELSGTAPKDFFRPNFFVNTPDINPYFLQTAGRAGFLMRAALAATLSGLWGVYNGFELCEAAAVPGKEEYVNSEKYEIKAWDYDRPGNIVAEITALNRIRRDNTALHTHLNVEFLPCDNPNILYFRKYAADGNNILVAVSLDPRNSQSATIELPLWRFYLPDDGALNAHDLTRDFAFTWQGKYQPVTLHPDAPYCIWRVAP